VIVVDASVLANALADDQAAGEAARGELRAADQVTAPDLVDVETVSVLRKRWLARTLGDQRFEAAVGHLQQLRFERVPTLGAEGSWRDRIAAITTATNVPRPWTPRSLAPPRPERSRAHLLELSATDGAHCGDRRIRPATPPAGSRVPTESSSTRPAPPRFLPARPGSDARVTRQ
jgi:predicted nucleic acid-binding protein